MSKLKKYREKAGLKRLDLALKLSLTVGLLAIMRMDEEPPTLICQEKL